MNTRDGGRWFVSPSVRCKNTDDGAILLEINEGLCCKLNVLAAQVWVTIENSPGGITLGGVVDALETRLQIPRRQLEQDTSDWLDKLQRLGLLQQSLRQIVDSG